jgi:hypothetical protein
MAALPQGFLSRPAVTEDVVAVAALEAQVFPDPWPRHLYLQEVGQPLRFQRVIDDTDGALAAYPSPAGRSTSCTSSRSRATRSTRGGAWPRH